MSAILKSRVRDPRFLSKLCKAEDMIPVFKTGDYLGMSGFTGVGGPKAVPIALQEHVEKNNLQGQLRFNLFVGASCPDPIEGKWAELDMIESRSPHQVGKRISGAINRGHMKFFDKHLSMWPQDLTYGYYTLKKAKPTIDVAIVEATAITEDGGIVPGASVGATPELVMMAEKVIIEVNTKLPNFEGLHDIMIPEHPPYRKPLFVENVSQPNGLPYLPIDFDKVVGVVESDYSELVGPNTPADDVSKAIAAHLVEFLEHEVKMGRMPENLHPLQSGIGNIANAVVEGLADASFKNLTVWTEVLQDSFLDFFDSGNLDFATATSIRLSPDGFERFFKNWDEYSKKLMLRSQQVSNSPEIIRRLGVIAMNTPVEVDIYAHANSTNVMGSRMLNGLGGSADFLRNAKLSVMHTPSSRPSKVDPHGLSCIIPFATHVDQTEHDLDVVVTEQGLADLRGLSPRERARVMIDKTAHPVYKPILTDYLDRAESLALKTGSLHEPHILKDAFKMHINLQEKGTMRLESWD
ncbi:uncharacterized protein V2V93DRAFT_372333 [Kockiozyma suomiensis]|uniref:uncharacterized protein n=1 Tax=Kockiozyma suomiensis TaxID=1337062 RepID=UPI0033432574